MSQDVTSKVNQFFSRYRPRSYDKGQILIMNGDSATDIYHLVRGTVKVYDISYRGEEIVLNVFKPPAFFPMSKFRF